MWRIRRGLYVTIVYDALLIGFTIWGIVVFEGAASYDEASPVDYYVYITIANLLISVVVLAILNLILQVSTFWILKKESSGWLICLMAFNSKFGLAFLAILVFGCLFWLAFLALLGILGASAFKLYRFCTLRDLILRRDRLR